MKSEIQLVTFLSDFGDNKFSQSIIKAHLYAANISTTILDVFHGNSFTDLESIAYELLQAIILFPTNTIHLLYGKYSLKNNDLLVIKVNNQWVICPDNGIFYLIQNEFKELSIYKIVHNPTLDFQNIMILNQYYIEIIKNIQAGKAFLPDLLTLNIMPSIPINSGLMISNELIIFRIININENFHAITNLTKKIFEDNIGNQRFKIEFITTTIDKISKDYNDVDYYSKIGALFNAAGYLEIFMMGDKLCKLYNISKKDNNSFQLKIL